MTAAPDTRFIKSLMALNGVRIVDIAKMCGRSITWASFVINGKVRPTQRQAEILQRALNTDLELFPEVRS